MPTPEKEVDYKYPKAPEKLDECSWCGNLVPEGVTIGGECVMCSMATFEKKRKLRNNA